MHAPRAIAPCRGTDTSDSGDCRSRVVKQTTRWLSSDVPGLVARQVDDNMMGRVSRFQVTDFGTQAIASNK